MRRLIYLSLFLAATAGAFAQPAPAVLYEGARLIIGTDAPPIEDGAMLVRDGRIVAVGRRGQVTTPAGAARVDLTGKTVMPGMINAHVHIGYEAFTAWGAEHYTPENIVNHLQREAFYGVTVTQTVGSSPTDSALQFARDQEAGKFPPASRFRFVPGMAPPNGGPDAILIKGTKALNATYEISTPDQARSTVRMLAGRGVKDVKIWVDDRRGTYPKMPPEVYNAVIADAHARGMRVHAHAIALADQKAVVGAGVDVRVHTVGAENVDEELLALIREKKPYWTTVIGLGDRSEACNNDPFIDQSYPPEALREIHEKDCAPRNNAAREAALAHNVKAFVDAGARLVLGTDAGIDTRHAFGWADHHEIARWVELGVTPAQAIVAATSRSAELLGVDAGALAPGKRADFIVLAANPLGNIRNTRTIEQVYLDGKRLDRDALRATFAANK
jgi:imidazolonepropionase-like amidohydrolase